MIGRAKEGDAIDCGVIMWFRESSSDHVVRKRSDGKHSSDICQNVEK
jgi:hypothetical protein